MLSLQNRYLACQEQSQKSLGTDEALEDFRWQLEELRISLFAQELKTPYPVSAKRLEKVWDELARRPKK